MGAVYRVGEGCWWRERTVLCFMLRGTEDGGMERKEGA